MNLPSGVEVSAGPWTVVEVTLPAERSDELEALAWASTLPAPSALTAPDLDGGPWRLAWTPPLDERSIGVFVAEVEHLGGVTAEIEAGLVATGGAAGRVDVGPFTIGADVEPSEGGLRIAAGPTFGTGSHVSTRLAISALAAWLRPGDSVVDLGSGSGILALAALRLGAESAVLIDVDPAAESVGRTNAEANGLGDRVGWGGARLEAPIPVSSPRVMAANLLLADLRRACGDADGRLEPGDRLVLSGVLDHQVDAAVEVVRNRSPSHPLVELDRMDAPCPNAPPARWGCVVLEVAA